MIKGYISKPTHPRLIFQRMRGHGLAPNPPLGANMSWGHNFNVYILSAIYSDWMLE